MDISKLKKQWNKYNEEFDNTEEMDIEKHINMAYKVGFLINEIDALNNKIKLLEQVNYEIQCNSKTKSINSK
jgi:hypothetical protein